MKIYSNGLDIHLVEDTTSLCYCWEIVRRDGVVLGFTDHDRDVLANNVLFLGTTGVTTTQIARRLGLAVDNLELTGAIDDEAITTLDIERGLYDDASVKLYVVNWRDPTQFDNLATGTFGNVNQNEDGFEVEFRTRSHTLSQPMGRIYQRTCDTKLGSAKCRVDLSNPNYTVTPTITAVDGHNITFDVLGFDDDWFALGKLVESNGAEHDVKRSRSTTITLWESPVPAPAVGDVVTLIVGCKQDAETCQAKFANIFNFQGCNRIPGNDRLTEYPIRGSAEYNGGSLFT